VHYYVSASHIEELDQLQPGKLFMVHVDDSQRLPMERLSNSQRCFMGEGRIDVPAMLNTINSTTSYDGYYSVELYDEDIWKLPADEVMTRLAASLKEVEKGIDFS
jgi:sugar phosphate isomerase/epimerase